MLESVRGNGTVIRTRLLNAVRSLQPRLLAVCAPAGYGKTLFSTRFAGDAPTVRIDCHTAQDEPAFSRALLAASAAGGSARSLDALSAWRDEPAESTTVIFDNADALEAPAHDLLRQCLAAPGSRRTTIVCSRSYLALPFSRALRPSDVVTVRARDLRLDREQIAELFGGALTEGDLDQVEELTQGWPLAVSMCRRAMQLGSLRRVLDDPDDVELSRVEGYIATEVVAPLQAAEIHALYVLSLLGTVTPDELAAALGLSRHDVIRLARRLPLVSHDDREFKAQPLLARYLLRHHPQRRRAAGQRASDLLLDAGENALAARCALAAGDAERAAVALNPGVVFVSAPPSQFGDLTRTVDAYTLARHPRLWSTRMLYRAASLSNAAWHAEAFAIWSQLPDDAPGDVVLGVANNVSAMLIILGKWEQLHDFRVQARRRFTHAGLGEDGAVRALETLWDAWTAAARLEPVDLESFLPLVPELLATDYVRAVVLRDIVAADHRRRGNRNAERTALAEAVRCAERGGVPLNLEICIRQAAISAWVAGEDDLFDEFVAAMIALKETHQASDAGLHFLACVAGAGASSASCDTTRPALRALTWLIGAERSDKQARRALVHRAIASADDCHYPEAMVLTRLVAAAIDEREDHRADEARGIVAALHGASIYKRHFEQADPAASPFATVLRRFKPKEAARTPLVVELLFGTVKSGAREIPLSGREFALLAYLALHQRPVTLDPLVDALWPEAGAADGIASVRVYVNRIRKRVAEPDAIVSTKRGYGAGPHVVTDIDAIDRAVSSADRTKAPEDVAKFLESRRRLARGVPAWVADLPGLVRVQARVNALLEELDALFACWRKNAPADVCLQFDAVVDKDEDETASA